MEPWKYLRKNLRVKTLEDHRLDGHFIIKILTTTITGISYKITKTYEKHLKLVLKKLIETGKI